MSIPKPIVTREHGSWAVLIVPLCIGAVQAGSFSWNVAAFSLSALGAFLGYVPVQTAVRERIRGTTTRNTTAWKFWLYFYTGLILLGFIPLLVQRLWLLIILGLLAVLFFGLNFFLTRTIHKSIAGDLAGVVGLSLGAPGAYYAATGRVDTAIVTTWFLTVLFFGCSVLYVHMKIQSQKSRRENFTLYEKLRIGNGNILYHAMVLLLVLVLVAENLTPALVLIAFIPMVVHSLVGTIRLDHPVHFKHLGFLLLGHAVLFASVMMWTMGVSR